MDRLTDRLTGRSSCRDVWKHLTSRPKASSGQRYPCPASLYWHRSSFGKQGSGPDRGRSPVEWGDFPYVRPSVRPYVRPYVCSPLWAIQPGLRPSQPGLKPEPGWLAGPQIWLAWPQAWLARPQAWLAGPQAWLAGPQAWLDGPVGGGERTDGRTDGKSPHSTGLRPLSGPLPCHPS